MKMLTAVLALTASSMSAQLTGFYTINQNAPASATNYTSISSFATDLNNLGVGGPVTASVVAGSGPYVQQVQFNSIPGASATNSILIQGGGNLLTFGNSTNAAQPWIMNLNGTDYLNVTNLNISGTGSYAYAVLLNGGANFNSFSNCVITVPNESTSTLQIPVLFSGSNTSYASAANSGSGNTFTGCTMISGYTGIWMYNQTFSPFNTGNTFINCQVRDFYMYGLYSYYQDLLIVRGCVFERPNRTTLTTGYGIFLTTGNSGALIEKNHVRRLFHGSPGFAGTYYGIYLTTNRSTGTGTMQSTVQNNIVSDMINNSGTCYGIFFSNANGFVRHNTVVQNNLNFNTTSTQYGYYIGGSTSYPSDYRNNLLYMTQGGTGTKYPVYITTTSGITANYNNYYVNNVGGTTFFYRAGGYASFGAYQGSGAEPNSQTYDPNFLNASAMFFHPTNASMNNLGTPLGIVDDYYGNLRSSTVPDFGAIEFLNTPCSGAPPVNTVLPPSGLVCANAPVSLGFLNPLTYTLGGLTFQWQASTTSSVGPWTSIPGATMQALGTNTTNSTWYSAIVTCTNGNGTTLVNAGQVQIAPTVTSSVTYSESFEGITAVNRLPNCSWAASNLGNTCLTYMSAQNNNRIARTGSKFASFYYLPGGVSYYYTNGIQLYAGVTYSASMWYTTEYYGYDTWSDLSILLGTSQSSTGLVTLASSNGPAISPSYKSLSNTFSVSTSGIYYVAIRATSNGACCGNYLSWDDLVIEAPCSLNSSNISIATTNSTVCQGQPVTLTASGAGSYNWNNGSTSAAITVTPSGNTTYMVTGLNALTGCGSTASQMINVNPSPAVAIFASSNSVCRGNSINLTAFGASNYNWNTGNSSPFITVSPTVSTTYTVIGQNQFGCTGLATQVVNVNGLPSINVGAPNNQICLGESINLSASGANSYTWSSISSYLTGQQVVVSPNTSVTYNITGTDANGCVGSTTFQLSVNACTGITETTTTASGIKVFPNPSNGVFVVEFNNDSDKTVEITDLAGRVVMTGSSNQKTASINISHLASGVYYAKLKTNNNVEVVKIVKE